MPPGEFARHARLASAVCCQEEIGQPQDFLATPPGLAEAGITARRSPGEQVLSHLMLSAGVEILKPPPGVVRKAATTLFECLTVSGGKRIIPASRRGAALCSPITSADDPLVMTSGSACRPASAAVGRLATRR